MSLKNIILVTFLFIITLWGQAFASDELVVVGRIPDRYIKTSSSAKKFQLGYVYIKDRIIKEVTAIKGNTVLKGLKKKFPKAKVIMATRSKTPTTRAKFDYLYPGMIDLHNHTKQNNINVWGEARGQFKNRFEWRAWKIYKYSVSGNMNPWIRFGKPAECAAFRWSELQAMILGVTYLQGPSSCIKGFSIHQVEDKASYVSGKEKVMAPTDLVIPADMTYVWQELKPLIDEGKTYEQALAQRINEACDLPQEVTAENVNSRKTLNMLKNKKVLVENCTKTKLHKKFIRYVYWIHGTIAGRKNYLDKSKHAAIIAHLAEGRRDDHYNQKEFEVVKLLGLDRPKVNFVHGVGISKEGMDLMGKKDMGLIWSLYSNLLLYGQTLDIYQAHKSGVKMSLGSDWLPTGTRGILEELKLAANYVDKDPEKQGLKKIFTDEELYKMVTENPAQMINHWDINERKNEHGIGRLVKGAMGSLISTSYLTNNPYTNLVRKVWSKDINLVVIDGKPIYGNTTYLAQAKILPNSYEEFPMYFEEVHSLKDDKDVSILPEKGATKATKAAHLNTIAEYVKTMDFQAKDNCGFKYKKGFVHQNSKSINKYLGPFQEATGMNLDRFADIHKLLAINLLTQTRNLNEPTKGKLEYAITTFPPLFSCHDETYMKRLSKFVSPTSNDDEFTQNANPAAVEELRKKQKLGRVPEVLAREYKD